MEVDATPVPVPPCEDDAQFLATAVKEWEQTIQDPALQNVVAQLVVTIRYERHALVGSVQSTQKSETIAVDADENEQGHARTVSQGESALFELPSEAVHAQVEKAISGWRTDRPTSACPMPCALEILRFVSSTSQGNSAALDYQLLCAVAHDATQRNAQLKKSILRLHTEFSEEVSKCLKCCPKRRINPIP